MIGLLSSARFGEVRDDEDYLPGYRSTGAPLLVDDGVRRRLLLYRVYLGLIMTVEPIARRSPAEPAPRTAAAR